MAAGGCGLPSWLQDSLTEAVWANFRWKSGGELWRIVLGASPNLANKNFDEFDQKARSRGYSEYSPIEPVPQPVDVKSLLPFFSLISRLQCCRHGVSFQRIEFLRNIWVELQCSAGRWPSSAPEIAQNCCPK
jgi:hypothetical protein